MSAATSFELRILLDDSSPLHPLDAGGTVIMRVGSDEHRTAFILVDLWMAELVPALRALEEHGEAVADFSQDHDAMVLHEIAEGELQVTWGDLSFRLGTDDFLEELHRVASDLLIPFRDHEEWEVAENFRLIERWVEGDELEEASDEDDEASSDFGPNA